MEKELTIIIPAKNEAGEIGELLDSIKNQTFENIGNIPIFVCDANSEDGTQEYVTAYQELDVKIIPGGLPGKGRNIGALNAKTKYILFMDADVRLINRNTISLAMDTIKKDQLYCLSVDAEIPDGNIIDKTLFTISHFLHQASAYFYPAATTQFLLFDREIFFKLGCFDEQMLAFEDIFLVRKVHKKRFRILNIFVSTNNRRLLKMGYGKVIKTKAILLWNYVTNNYKYYYVDIHYWD